MEGEGVISRRQGGSYKIYLTSIPTYAMFVYKIPLSICQQISSIIQRFCWSSHGDRSGLSWFFWDKICAPKHEGGLSFKDLVLFNQSLLAKQG